MATFTKQAIMRTFAEMLEDMPFDKITVSAITKRCGIGHNTFYYHYQDIYDLLDEWLRKELGPWTKNLDGEKRNFDRWEDDLKAILHSCQENKKVVDHIFDGLSRDRLERYVFSFADNVFLQYVEQQPGAEKVSPQRRQDIANYCRYAFFGYFLKFLWNNMADDVDSGVDRLADLFPGFVQNALENSTPN